MRILNFQTKYIVLLIMKAVVFCKGCNKNPTTGVRP